MLKHNKKSFITLSLLYSFCSTISPAKKKKIVSCTKFIRGATRKFPELEWHAETACSTVVCR